ncbi:uncharacterized protein CXorf65 homolog isoform X1 [Chiloscyllium plagiosum]|uniref:uncharacterized protein CXorf65 homolog isoform X1 n=1 Tax=Chiloscyllium plagiosum TaxID=36176 RepID=UPI001CB82E2F|nr:uncharacterized protein CXorf65 homolog isoform X1 [Chiloscyllium plagiosum]
MFITVLYGDNEHALFNIFCKIPVLLDCIKQNCHREIKAEIDLADESGQVKNLLQNQHCYASDILAERAVYILLGVNKPSRASTPVYIPLLNNDNIVNSKFLAKLGARLDSLSQPQGKVKKIHKNSASPSPSRSSTTDGKQNTSPHGKCKNTSTP